MRARVRNVRPISALPHLRNSPKSHLPQNNRGSIAESHPGLECIAWPVMAWQGPAERKKTARTHQGVCCVTAKLKVESGRWQTSEDLPTELSPSSTTCQSVNCSARREHPCIKLRMNPEKTDVEHRKSAPVNSARCNEEVGGAFRRAARGP